jgi:glycosyltransferase involved in cell wall biosynthesis
VDDVAVVIPTHDRPVLVRRALASALTQSLQPAEVVVVDVGGASWTHQLQRLAECTDTPVRILHTSKPAFAGRARNLGAAATSAGTLAFLDDDDCWAPGYLAQAVAALREHPDGLVVTPLLVRRASSVLTLPAVTRDVTAAEVLAHNPGVTGTNMLLRRDQFCRVGGFDESLSAFNDLDLLVRLLDAGVLVVPTAEPLAEQLLHASDQVSQPSVQRLLALGLYLEKHGSRMSRAQRRSLARERHWMEARLAPRQSARTRHRGAQLLLTSPPELVRTASRRWRLRSRPAAEEAR